MQDSVAPKQENKPTTGLARREETPLFLSLQQEVDRLFDEFRHGFGLAQPSKWFEPLSQVHAKVDVKDSDNQIVVTAEIPGVDAKDMDISLTPDGLSIKGEKRIEKEEKDKGYYRMERSYGYFHRLIALPCEIDKQNINADYKDGVLKITLPKSKEALKAEQKIEIKAG